MMIVDSGAVGSMSQYFTAENSASKKIDVIFLLIPEFDLDVEAMVVTKSLSSEFSIRVISLAWSLDPALLLLLCIINTADYFDRAHWGGGRQTKFCSETLRNEKIKSASRPLTINLM